MSQRVAESLHGWVGVDPESSEVLRQRDYLREHNGIVGLEVVDPNEVETAVRLFRRDGFVVVRDVLDPQQLDFLLQGAQREIAQILQNDANRQGNRGSHRYSFGAASLTGQLLHLREWAMLVDLPKVTPILQAIFDSDTYHVRGGGGDFCLPGAVNYQRLHADMGDRRRFELADGSQQVFGSFLDHRQQLSIRDLPVPYVCCNFLTVDFTAENGPTRQIPGTQHSRERIPNLESEPEWMRLSTVCPAPAGSVLMRDVRAWHGGTPNLSNQVRAIPNCEFFAPWYREAPVISMPRPVFDELSPYAQQLCRSIVADSAEELTTGYRQDLSSNEIKLSGSRKLNP